MTRCFSSSWMRLAIHELDAARRTLQAGQMRPAFKMLARLSRIFEQLNSAWEVLRTMTPSDYTTFRASLGQSSGFQSHQYRLIEFILGNRNAAMLRPPAHRPGVTALLQAELARPSLSDVALQALHAARLGLVHPDSGEPMRWEAPLPPDMAGLLALMRTGCPADPEDPHG